MGSSALHLHVKNIAAMSPLQYQKQLRLQEARRLMLGDGLDAAQAAFRGRYESPSQFSREYRRAFGSSPTRCGCRESASLTQAVGTEREIDEVVVVPSANGAP